MTSPRLSTLKIRVDHLLMGVGAVAVAAIALFGWRARGPGAEPDKDKGEGLERLRDKPDERRAAAPPRFMRSFYASAPREAGGGPFVPPPRPDPGALGPEEAVDSFQEVMGELEAIAQAGHELSEEEEAELYERATGSFTALSAWADPNDSSERALLDEAYLRMKSLLGELDIEPPRRDPDPPRIIR